MLKKIIAQDPLVTVISAKGGTGKTTASLLLGLELAARKKPVLHVDYDFTSPMINAKAGLETSYEYSIAALLQGEKTFNNIFLKKETGNRYVLGTAEFPIQEAGSNQAYLSPLIQGLIQRPQGYAIADLSAGNYSYTQRFALLGDVLLVVVQLDEEQIFLNSLRQIKLLLNDYHLSRSANHFPQVILVGNQEKTFGAFNAQKAWDYYEQKAKDNDWYEHLGRSALIAGAVGLPSLSENIGDSLRKDRIPKKLEKPIQKLADVLLKIPAAAISTQERYTRVVATYEQREFKSKK